jgi:hypothetical protein
VRAGARAMWIEVRPEFVDAVCFFELKPSPMMGRGASVAAFAGCRAEGYGRSGRQANETIFVPELLLLQVFEKGLEIVSRFVDHLLTKRARLGHHRIFPHVVTLP